MRAVAHDLKTFFSVIDNDPGEVVAADIFGFVADQRGDRTVVRISNGEPGLSARTIARRLSSISGFYAYLVARGDTAIGSNPVLRGLSTRRRGGRRAHGEYADRVTFVPYRDQRAERRARLRGHC